MSRPCSWLTPGYELRSVQNSGVNRHILYRPMPTNLDARNAAEASLQALVDTVQEQPPGQGREAFLAECSALAVAIRAFHMEAIRFRMFNVDRAITRGAVALPEPAR